MRGRALRTPEQRILAALAAIPAGRVTTYGVLGRRAGLPRHARLVARVLATLPAGSELPWHRVVAAGGRIALPERSAARRKQLARLAAESVVVRNGRVDLERHGWGGAADDLDRLLWGTPDET
jgi:methylated-DNA-protein-cysteine methyltransferase-like protein